MLSIICKDTLISQALSIVQGSLGFNKWELRLLLLCGVFNHRSQKDRVFTELGGSNEVQVGF